MIEKVAHPVRPYVTFRQLKGELIIGFCETSSYALSKMFNAYSGTLSRLQSP